LNEMAKRNDAVSKVLIIGASRGIGLETLKRALRAGHKVRALARSASKIPVSHPDLEKVTGDALDRGAVKQALIGVDAVIQVLGAAASPEIIFKPVRLFSEATRVLVSAMEETGVKRLICVTGFGAGDSRDKGGFLYNTAFHLFLGRAYDDKDAQERIIRKSTLEWLIARPVILTNGPRTRSYRVLVDPKDWRCGFISRADVADFLVKQIDDDTLLGKTPVLVD
jgi:putative NADH-flavin reductase